MRNNFIKALFTGNTFTENGAKSNTSTGSPTLDYFSKAGTYRDRTLEEVFADISMLWDENPRDAMKVIFYNRMVSRKSIGFANTEKAQAGQGNKDEFRKSIIWIARYYPQVLNQNLWMIPLVGCWKDLWHEDLLNELDSTAVYQLIQKGIDCDYNSNLVAKYLPRIRSKSNVYNERHTTLNQFGFGLIKFLKWTPTQYRKFKASGEAHEFQQLLSKGLFNHVDFNSIPGKALFQLVNRTGRDGKTTIERHGLETQYINWIKDQPIAKFTGYVYELMQTVNTSMTIAQKYTVDKQFEGLLKLANDNGAIQENVWCALDTSGSMTASVADTTAYDICLSLGVYFSSLNQGSFQNQVIMFDNVSKVKQLSGSFSDKVMQIRNENTAWGSTNFQSVINEIVRIRLENPNIPLEDYPATLLVVSDMQFNPVRGNTRTNYRRAMEKLASIGLPNMKIVWWWVTGRAKDFPSNLDDEGVTMIGGFDGSILSLLLNEEVKEKSDKVRNGPLEAMHKALNQEVLELIQV